MALTLQYLTHCMRSRNSATRNNPDIASKSSNRQNLASRHVSLRAKTSHKAKTFTAPTPTRTLHTSTQASSCPAWLRKHVPHVQCPSRVAFAPWEGRFNAELYITQRSATFNNSAGVAQSVERVALTTETTSRSRVRAPPSAIPILTSQMSSRLEFLLLLLRNRPFKCFCALWTCCKLCWPLTPVAYVILLFYMP